LLIRLYHFESDFCPQDHILGKIKIKINNQIWGGEKEKLADDDGRGVCQWQQGPMSFEDYG
jgi:hypothetical protein